MAQSIELKKAFEFRRDMWAKMVAYAIPAIKVRTDAGRDRDGRPFPAYSEKYAEVKARGHTRLTTRAGAKGTKYAHLSGVSTERQTTPPNFQLRRVTLRDLQQRFIGRLLAIIGWRGEPAEIVSAHEQRGKYKVGGITTKEHEKIVKIADSFFVAQWNRKTKNVKIVVQS